MDNKKECLVCGRSNVEHNPRTGTRRCLWRDCGETTYLNKPLSVKQIKKKDRFQQAGNGQKPGLSLRQKTEITV